MGDMTAELKQFYKVNGYIVIKDALTKEELSRENDELFKRKNQAIIEPSWVGRRDDNLRITNNPTHTLVTLCPASNIEQNIPLSAYGYIRKVAIPLGEEIREKEEFIMNQEVFGRITGGSTSNEGQFPYQAGVLTKYKGINGTGVCGGSLIAVNRVVHSAHCWYDGENQGYVSEIVLGSLTLFYGGSRQTTKRIVTHPLWNPNSTQNDVAVIYLTTSVKISNDIAPIALPSGCQLNETFAGEIAVATGYGRTGDSENDRNPSQRSLRHVHLIVITNELCSYFYHDIIDDSKLCIIGYNGTNICSGDSGGPLAVTRNHRPVLIGITSFGSALGCELQHPAGFSRVTSFITFFKEHL